MLLDVPPALAHLEEDGGVAADDDDARHQEGQQHQELLRRAPLLPESKDQFGLTDLDLICNKVRT